MVVGRGEIRDEVIDYVANAKADLLVIGTRELGALKR
jgi:nucleotide-binding universal stress UspA family protein